MFYKYRGSRAEELLVTGGDWKKESCFSSVYALSCGAAVFLPNKQDVIMILDFEKKYFHHI